MRTPVSPTAVWSEEEQIVHSNYQERILTKSAGVAAPPQLTATSTAAFCKTKQRLNWKSELLHHWACMMRQSWVVQTIALGASRSLPFIDQEGWRQIPALSCTRASRQLNMHLKNTLSVTSSFPFPLIQATALTPKNQMQVTISRTAGVAFSQDSSSLTISLHLALGRDFTHNAKNFCNMGGPQPARQVLVTTSDTTATSPLSPCLRRNLKD